VRRAQRGRIGLRHESDVPTELFIPASLARPLRDDRLVRWAGLLAVDRLLVLNQALADVLHDDAGGR
jgi:hypothetical protein